MNETPQPSTSTSTTVAPPLPVPEPTPAEVKLQLEIEKLRLETAKLSRETPLVKSDVWKPSTWLGGATAGIAVLALVAQWYQSSARLEKAEAVAIRAQTQAMQAELDVRAANDKKAEAEQARTSVEAEAREAESRRTIAEQRASELGRILENLTSQIATASKQVENPCIVSGRVVDIGRGGRPIAGAAVAAYLTASEADDRVAVVAQTSTDAAGRFEFKAPRGGHIAIVVNAAGYEDLPFSLALVVSDSDKMDVADLDLVPMGPGRAHRRKP